MLPLSDTVRALSFILETAVSPSYIISPFPNSAEYSKAVRSLVGDPMSTFSAHLIIRELALQT
jgi:hypothetical protein